VPRPFSFTAQADFRGSTAEVAICGDADITATAALEEMITFALSKRPRHLILDLSGVGFLDCAAARVIARAAQALSPGQLTIRDPSLPAYRVLQLTGLAALIEDSPGRAGTYADHGRRSGVR
jgi:anti-anti-sigma factor